MERKTFKRIVRDRHLTPDEVAADEAVRRKVMQEFPPAQGASEIGAISSELPG